MTSTADATSSPPGSRRVPGGSRAFLISSFMFIASIRDYGPRVTITLP